MTNPEEKEIARKRVDGSGEPDGLTSAISENSANREANSGGNGDRQAGQASATGVSATLPKIIPFSSLVRCGDEVWIEHAGNLYRLRRTKQDKLILTK